jgi:hypothetical protein
VYIYVYVVAAWQQRACVSHWTVSFESLMAVLINIESFHVPEIVILPLFIDLKLPAHYLVLPFV